MKKEYLSKLLYQIIFWILAYNLISFIKYFDYNEILALSQIPIQEEHIFLKSILMSTLAGFFQGFLLTFVDIIIAIHLKKDRSFLSYVLHKSASYYLIITIILFISVLAMQISRHDTLSLALNVTIQFMSSRLIITYMLLALIMSVFISFLNQIYKNIGPHIFLSMLAGKYYTPVIENRIFMFIDLKSSTTYAEQLGHILFSKLIQDCFFDLNKSVEKYGAQIDQYIGDEAVLTWKIKSEKENMNCIFLYFDYKKRLLQKEKYYTKTYGFLPEFKAGINSGTVTVAEVGVIKKSIAYHGDVLNTAARIQNQCNKFSKELLIAEEFLNILPAEKQVKTQYVDNITLKGKVSETRIFSISLEANET